MSPDSMRAITPGSRSTRTAPGGVFSVAVRVKKHLLATAGRGVALGRAIGAQAVFAEDQPPKLMADLIASLSDMNRKNLSHCVLRKNRLRENG